MEQALRIALIVQEAERQKQFNESFYTQFEESVRLSSRSPSRASSESERQRQSADSQTGSYSRAQRYNTPSRAGRSQTPAREKRKSRSSCVATNVMAYVISLEGAQPGKKGEQKPLTRL